MTTVVEPRKHYPRGTYSKIARKLGVTPQTVRGVALGNSRSARIERELRRAARLAARRKERELTAPTP